VPLKSAIGQWSIVIGPRVRPARSAGTTRWCGAYPLKTVRVLGEGISQW